MKIVYMLILGVYELGLVITQRHLLDINKQLKKDVNRDLRMVVNLLIGITPIAICLIGALG